MTRRGKQATAGAFILTAMTGQPAVLVLLLLALLLLRAGRR